jgi:predicted exporter
MARAGGWTAGGALVALLALGAAATRLHVETDVAGLLPGGPGSPREAAARLSEFGALDTLLIDLELPGASPEALAGAADAYASQLRQTGRFADVYTGPTTGQMLQMGEVLRTHALLLLADPAAALVHALEPAALDGHLAALKDRLAGPEGMVLKDALLTDPLGFTGDLMHELAAMGGATDLYQGHLLSADFRHALLVTTPRTGALDTAASGALLDVVQAEAARLPSGPGGHAIVLAVGGPRFAAESAALAQRDVRWNFVTSAAALLALFLLRFRSPRTFAIAALPIVFGVAGAIAAVALFRGRIQGLTLGFGSALIGIALDYPMYLLNRASAEPGESAQRMSAALDDVWSSLWLGWATTLACFLALFLSRFPALHELALFAGAGITTAFVFTLLWVPPLAARFGPVVGRPVSWVPQLERYALGPRGAAAIALLVGAGGVIAVPALAYDGDLRHLDTQRAQTLREYDEVMQRFGQSAADAMVISSGATLEEALGVNDRVQGALARAEHQGWVDRVRSVSPLLPSRGTQTSRAGALAALDLTALRARFDEEAGLRGFRPAAFDAFWRDVSRAARGQNQLLRQEDLAGTAVEPLVARAVHCDRGCEVMTALRRRTPDVAALAGLLPQGASLVDAQALAAQTLVQIPRQLLFLCGVGWLSNVLLLALAYRSLRAGVLACLPCLLGLLGTLGILSAARVPLDLVSGSALVLIVGCGVDYGIFLFHGLSTRAAGHGVDALGVVLTSGATLLGFGTMAFAGHRALQSIGLAISIGIALSGAATLFLMPGLAQLLLPRARRAP